MEATSDQDKWPNLGIDGLDSWTFIGVYEDMGEDVLDPDMYYISEDE